MTGGKWLRNWPVGLVVVAATGLSLAAARGGWAHDARYPVRIALAPVEKGASPRLMALETVADSTPEAAGPAEAAPVIVSPDFAEAFAGLGSPTPPPVARATSAKPAEADGMLAVHFDLTDPYAGKDGSAPIEVQKGVRVNGADVGRATIRVTDGATIAIDRDELGKLLTAAGRQDTAKMLAGGGSFVSFDRVRQAGLSVRYDAASDRILLAS